MLILSLCIEISVTFNYSLALSFKICHGLLGYLVGKCTSFLSAGFHPLVGFASFLLKEFLLKEVSLVVAATATATATKVSDVKEVSLVVAATATATAAATKVWHGVKPVIINIFVLQIMVSIPESLLTNVKCAYWNHKHVV